MNELLIKNKVDYIPDLRAYFFGNMYLSQIQHGIQAAHVVTTMFTKYEPKAAQGQCLCASVSNESEVLHEWAHNHMTKDLRVGGYQSNLYKIYALLEIVCPIIGVPFSKFQEEQDALNGALTSVGVIFDRNKGYSAFTNMSLDQLTLTVNYELRGDGLSEMECYGILNAIVESCRRA